MPDSIMDLPTLLRQMEPVQQPGVFAFCSLSVGQMIDPALVLASIVEPEGLSVVVREDVAQQHGLPILFRSAWIMLTVEKPKLLFSLSWMLCSYPNRRTPRKR